MLVEVGFSSKYLDSSELTEGSIMKKTCYLYDTNYGMTKLSEPFYSFFFKDVNSNIVVGRLFSIDKLDSSGANIALMRRQAVEITFEVQVYKDNTYLVISEIKLSKDLDFPYDKFIGAVDGSEDACANLNNTIEQVLNKTSKPFSKYRVFRSHLLADGRTGAYAIALEMVVANMTAASRLPSIVPSDLFRTFYLTQHFYWTYLKAIEDVDFVTEATKLSYLNKAYLEATKTEGYNQDIIMDTFSSILGLTKPEHLYAHILNDAFKQSFNMINLSYKFTQMPMYSVNREGDVILRRY